MVTLRILCLGFVALLHAAPGASAQETPPDSKARLEMIFDDRKAPPFVREMVLVTVRGTYAFGITRERLELPYMRDFEWIKLNRDTWDDVVIDGRSVHVMERRFALFPLRAGRLTLEPAVHAISVVGKNGGRREIAVKSAPVMLDVLPAPADAGDWWLPARALEVSDHWSTEASRLRDGENVVRTVTVKALGASEQMIPPQPAMRAPWLITFTDPEERSMELTPVGPLTKVVWRWTLRPITGEPGVLPQVTIPWFDTDERRSRTAILPAAPFGYAGFADNTASRWQSVFSGYLVAGLALTLGVALPLLLLSPRGRMRRVAEIIEPIRRLLPSPAVRALRRAGRRADLPALWVAADLVARSAPAEKGRRLEGLLLVLDRELFGRGDPSLRLNARNLARAIEEAAASRSKQ